MMAFAQLLFRIESALVLIPDLVLLLAIVGIWLVLGLRWTGTGGLARRRRWSRGRMRALLRARPVDTVGGIVILLTLGATFAVVMAPRYWTIATAPLVLLFGRALASTRWPRVAVHAILVAIIGVNIVNREGALFPDLEHGIALQLESAYKFRERSHEFIPYLKSDVEAMRRLSEHHSGTPIITASPYALFLSFPELGYVTKPINGAVLGIPGGVPPHFVDVDEWLKTPPSTDPIFIRGRFLARSIPFPPYEEGDFLILEDELPDPLTVFQKRFERTPSIPLESWYASAGWMGNTLADKADLRARALAWTGRSSKALADLANAVELEPGSAEVRFIHGQWLLMTGQVDAAVAQLRQCLAIDPHRPGAAYALGLALRGTGRYPEAIAAFQLAMRGNPADARSASELGRLLLGTAKLDEALPYLQFAVSQGVRDRDTCMAMGQALAKLDRHEEAVGWHALAAQSDPGSLDAVGTYAAALANVGDIERAIPILEHAISLQPSNAELHVYLATLLTRSGRRSEATNSLRRALAINPHHPLAMNNLAWELAVSPDANVRNPEESLGLARRLVEETQRQEPAYLDTLAAALARLGRFDEAVAVIDEAMACSKERQKAQALEELAARKRLYLRRIPYTAPYIKTDPLHGQ